MQLPRQLPKANIMSATRSSILSNIINVVLIGCLHTVIGKILICLCVLAFLSYKEALLLSQIVTDINNVQNYIIQLLIFNVTSSIVTNYYNRLKQKDLLPTIQRVSRNYFWTLFEKADPDWLEGIDALHTVVSDGVMTIRSVINQSLHFIKPIIQSFSQMVVVISLIGIKGLIVIVVILLIMSLGMVVIYYDFKSMKELKKETTDDKENVRHKSENFLIDLLNGRGKQARIDIVNSWVSLEDKKRIHSMKITKYYNYLEILHTVVLSLTILYISTIISGKEFIGAFFAINKTCDTAWWLFNSLSSVMQNISEWGSIERILKEYVPLKTKPTEEMLPQNVLPMLKTSSEIKIGGESGAGKTTWIFRKVIALYKKYKVGQWIYLTQNMVLSKSERSIYKIMSDYLPTTTSINLEILFEYSHLLGIDNVINSNTIHQKFNKPSGGEVKRILFLRSILPILMFVSTVKVIFCDEISAGLDTNSWYYIRNVMTILKEQHGIKFVNIDHHESDADTYLNVMKKTINIDEENTSQPTNVKAGWITEWIADFLAIYRTYKPETSKTKVLVWISEIEPEPYPESLV